MRQSCLRRRATARGRKAAKRQAAEMQQKVRAAWRRRSDGDAWVDGSKRTCWICWKWYLAGPPTFPPNSG